LTSFCTVLKPDKRIFFVIGLLLIGASGYAETKLSLTEAVQKALEHSYNVKMSRHDSLSAVSDLKSARTQRYPSLSLNAVSYYIDQLQEVSIIPGRTLELGSHENYQTDFKLTVPFYTGGKIGNQIKIQKENLTAKSYSLESEKMAAAYQARKGYLNLMLTRYLVAAAKSSQDRIDIIARDVQNLFQSGLADSVDILDAASATQQGLLGLTDKENLRRNASIALAQQLGLSALEEIAPTETAPDPLPLSDNDNSGQSLSIDRPELKGLDSRLRAANYLVSFNRAGYFPLLSGYAGYSYGKPNRDQFNKSWNGYFNVGLSLNWEFNLGNRTHHNINSARQSALSLEMSRRRLEENFNLQADLAHENLKKSYQYFVINKKELEIATHKFRLAREKHNAGKLSVNRLLEMESELATVEQGYYAAIINYYLAETEYLYAIGAPKIFGGF
jgi:outer membrane protein TolC